MAVSAGPDLIEDGLVLALDAGNLKSYSGSGTNITNIIRSSETNTLGVQTFVQGTDSGSSYFQSHSSTSKVSLSGVSVDPSSGGFTVCMLVETPISGNSNSVGSNNTGEWNYWFKQQNSDNTQLVEIGTRANFKFEMKDDISDVYYGDVIFESGSNQSGIQTTWTVPVGVTSVTAVVVGGGGGGGGKGGETDAGGGGGGGGLSHGTFTVTPGETLYIQAGCGGTGGLSEWSDYITGIGFQSQNDTNGYDGQDSYIKRTSHAATGNDILLLGGKGGFGGTFSGGTGGTGNQGSESDGGGNGGGGGNGSGSFGGGGGGAGGYNGNGGGGGRGYASFESFGDGYSGSGGGGGGGGSSGTSTSSGRNYSSGGGVGAFGQGASGTRGTSETRNIASRGRGGSGGGDGSIITDHQDGGSNLASLQYWLTGGGLYGGGGAGGADGPRTTAPSEGSTHAVSARPGGRGVVRIVWGNTRQFPTTAVSQDSFPLNKLSVNCTPSTANDWNYVCFGATADYKSFISIDGNPKTKSASATDWNNSDPLTFSNIFGDGSSNFTCNWAHCLIYNRELSDDEIKKNFTKLKVRQQF
jgi:V8-like Glu-specific endopeptidase